MIKKEGVAVVFLFLISCVIAQQNDGKKYYSERLTRSDGERYEREHISPDFVDHPTVNETKGPNKDDSCNPLHRYLQVDDLDSGVYDDDKNLPKNSCARKCGGKARICYYKFHLEPYTTMGRACGSCHINSSQCLQPQCVSADGFEKAILTVNRRMPAPSIQVCEGDLIVVDVINRMPGKSTTIHWHGIRMRKTPHMDGVPMVTQCPILEGTTFRYTFRADDPGLHFYHSHDGLQKVDGLSGSLLVRQAPKKDPNANQYDYGLRSHMVVVQDWHHRMADEMYPGLRFRDLRQHGVNYLIQGCGQYIMNDGTPLAPTPLTVYNVTQGHRYVFHIVAATCFQCQYELSIENHTLTVIRADARPCKPFEVDSVTMSPGERYSVVVNAKQPVDSYWLSVRTVGLCTRNVTDPAYQLAILHYKGASPTPTSSRPNYDESKFNKTGKTLSPVNSKCNEEDRKRFGPCIDELRDVEPANSVITKDVPDLRVVWAFGFDTLSTEELFRRGDFKKFIQSTGPLSSSSINGIVNIMSPSPLLSQYKNVPKKIMCEESEYNASTWRINYRECVHTIKLPTNKVVEIIAMDRTNHNYLGISHTVHLHGHDLYVMECGLLDQTDPNTTLTKLIDYLDSTNRRPIPVNPATKDTFALSAGGYVILRIITNNPGFWYFHCHLAYHLDTGMSGILQVGNVEDFPPPPKGFPRCGNYVPER